MGTIQQASIPLALFAVFPLPLVYTLHSLYAVTCMQVVDAVFLCFAMDRDMALCTRLEIHEVYCQLPTVGPVVEQPGGEVAYGQPAVRHV